MKAIALTLAVLAALGPSLAAAQGCEHDKARCGEGQIWDSATRSCVPQPSS